MDSPRLERSSLEDNDTLVDQDTYATEDLELLADEKLGRPPVSRWRRRFGLRRSSLSLHERTSTQSFSFMKIISFGLYHLFAIFGFLLPSYLTNLLSLIFPKTKATTTVEKPLHETAYLDGLRGVAAFIVYIFHWSYLWFPFLRKGFESSATSENLFIQRPIIRFLHSGRASVTLFFVISGYVITLKTLSIIHVRQPGKALEVLSGSLFRRPLRLYLPIIAQTLIILVLIRWNVIQGDISGAIPPPRKGTLWEQLHHWWDQFCYMTNPFRAIVGRQNLWGNPYDGHLWTIPTEFKGSLTVFLFLLSFARARRWLHLAVVGAAIVWLTQLGELDMALFCAGMVLAELSLVFPPGGWQKGAPLLPSQKPGRATVGRERLFTVLRHVVTMALYIVGLHLMSYPEIGGPISPGYRTLSKCVPGFYAGQEGPTQWFCVSVGSVLFILALMYSPATPSFLPSLSRLICCRPRARKQQRHREDIEQQDTAAQEAAINQPQNQPLLQRAFTHPFSQYLGHISYALYLAHGTVNHTVGTQYLNPAFNAWRDANKTADTMPKDGAKASAMLAAAWSAYMWKAAWGTMVNTFVLFWVSDVFWRAVDVKAVKLTRWLAEKAKRE